MKFLKNSKTAVIITVLLIFISTLTGSARSLGALRRDTVMVFYNGVSGDGIGIFSDLSRRIDLTNNLLVIAGKYLPENDKEAADVARAKDMLFESLREYSVSARSLENVSVNNRLLTDTTTALLVKLSDMPLSEKDMEYCRGIEVDLKARNNTILHDGYNQIALEFNETLKKFPANILAVLTGTKPAEVF